MQHLLLDTNVVLWWLTAHPRLDSASQALIAEAECHLSAASIWEVAIKHKLGKLPLAPKVILDATRKAHISIVPITAEHGIATADLPLLHSDPFDRMLIAQARSEHLTLVTGDRILAQYGNDILNI